MDASGTDSGGLDAAPEDATPEDAAPEDAAGDAGTRDGGAAPVPATCDEVASGATHFGCVFFTADLDNEWAPSMGSLGDLTAAADPFALLVANPQEGEVTVEVTRNDAPVGAAVSETTVRSATVPAGEVARIELPQREVDGRTAIDEDAPGSLLSSLGYRIQSSAPLVVHQLNPVVPSAASNDGSLLLPVERLGTEHLVAGWPTANPTEPFGDMVGIPDHSFVTIVGVEAETSVTVTPSQDVVAGDGVPATSAGEPLEVTLGPYDVLNLETDGEPGDFTGTHVASSAPVAVFTGGERGLAPIETDGVSMHPSGDSSACCTDHLEEQLPPTSRWGTEVAVARSPVRTDHSTWREPDMYRVLAARDGTTVSTTLPAPDDSFALDAGEHHQLSSSDGFVVTASDPILVTQVLVSQRWVHSFTADHGGDPSLLLLPAIGAHRRDHHFGITDAFPVAYVTITAREGAGVRLDGADVTGDCTFEELGSAASGTFVAHTCSVTPGYHVVDADAPAGVSIYGYADLASYAYPASWGG